MVVRGDFVKLSLVNCPAAHRLNRTRRGVLRCGPSSPPPPPVDAHNLPRHRSLRKVADRAGVYVVKCRTGRAKRRRPPPPGGEIPTARLNPVDARPHARGPARPFGAVTGTLFSFRHGTRPGGPASYACLSAAAPQK